MVDTCENVVDAKLDKFLNEDLPVNSVRAPCVSTSEEFKTEEVSKPITDRTLRQILFYLSKGINPEDAGKIVELMNGIQEMNEQEAQVLLKGLKIKCQMAIDSDLVKYMTKELVHMTFNPNDKKRKRAAKNSKYINECFGEGLNDFFGQFGWWAGLVVFGIYATASWRLNPEKNETSKRRKTGEEIEEKN